MSAVQVFWKHCGKRKNCSQRAISPFPTVFSTQFKNFQPFSSDLKLSSANSFRLEESKICHLGKGYDWSLLKPFADNKINSAEKLKFVLERVENIVGKGENAGYPQFLLFPQCFQKSFILGVIKIQDYVVKSSSQNCVVIGLNLSSCSGQAPSLIPSSVNILTEDWW